MGLQGVKAFAKLEGPSYLAPDRTRKAVDIDDLVTFESVSGQIAILIRLLQSF
jgi:hypothetical protein